MEMTIGFSTCPNDTFIFDAMVNGKIDTGGLIFRSHLADVEELNRAAGKGRFDITKISYHAYAHIADRYRLLDAGSALGRNNGPLVISKREIDPGEIPALKIAVPGNMTTAYLLFRLAWPDAGNTVEYLFSDIEDAVLDGDVDAGLIIHENRFTYRQKGLRLVRDMGEYWEEKTSSPIPLGGIAIRRDIPVDTVRHVNSLIRESIQHSMLNPVSPYDYIRKYAIAMDKNVMQKHIELYVNDFSLDLGQEGRRAVLTLYDEAVKGGLLDSKPEDIFCC